MKTIRMSVVLASMAGAATLFLAVPASMSASPDSEWDVTYYTGEPTEGSSYLGTAMAAAPGQGFDLFNSNADDGVNLEDFAPAYMGTSMEPEAGSGLDVFRARARESDPLF